MAKLKVGIPNISLGITFTGLRTDIPTVEPASAHSRAISPPELPNPTINTRFASILSALVNSLEWINMPE
jgi:hypothetical protein